MLAGVGSLYPALRWELILTLAFYSVSSPIKNHIVGHLIVGCLFRRSFGCVFSLGSSMPFNHEVTEMME